MMDQIACVIGYAIMVAGGSLLTILLLSILAWGTFEYVFKRMGYLKRLKEWREAARREAIHSG